VSTFLAQDHARLDALLVRSVATPGTVDMKSYAQFRAGLLRHIGMEEKILIPDARRRRGGEPLPVAAQLRADHAALAALLVPTPTHAVVATIRAILDDHNPLEEDQHNGLYVICERLAGADARALVARLQAAREVPVAAHVDGPRVQAHIANLVAARLARAPDK
jgi:hypothetical protein